MEFIFTDHYLDAQYGDNHYNIRVIAEKNSMDIKVGFNMDTCGDFKVLYKKTWVEIFLERDMSCCDFLKFVARNYDFIRKMARV